MQLKVDLSLADSRIFDLDQKLKQEKTVNRELRERIKSLTKAQMKTDSSMKHTKAQKETDQSTDGKVENQLEIKEVDLTHISYSGIDVYVRKKILLIVIILSQIDIERKHTHTSTLFQMYFTFIPYVFDSSY